MSSIGSKLKYARVIVFGFRHLGKWNWLNAMAKMGFVVPPGTVWDANKGIYFRDLDMWFRQVTPLFFEVIKSFEHLTITRARKGASYKELDDTTLQVTVQGLTFTLNTWTEFHTIAEIFAKHVYQFSDAGPYLIFDGGMNKGLASLFFAQTFDAQVLGFELIPDTAAQAKRNVELNPQVSDRILCAAFGLSSENKTFEIQYAPEQSNEASLHDFLPTGKTLKTVTVEVRDVAEVVSENLAKFPGRTVVLKLDIEGSEYEVIPRLNQTGLLDRIDVIVMEWHDSQNGSVEETARLLTEQGFTVFCQAELYMPAGMLYAVKGALKDRSARNVSQSEAVRANTHLA